MASQRNIRYSPLSAEEEHDYDGSGDDPWFSYTPKSFDKVPWKSIALALFLLFLGSSLFFLSFFVFTGHMRGDWSQAYGLLFSASLPFFQAFMRLELLIIHGEVPKAIDLHLSPDTEVESPFNMRCQNTPRLDCFCDGFMSSTENNCYVLNLCKFDFIRTPKSCI